MSKMYAYNCLCDDPNHEMCWDSFVSRYDPECDCCQETATTLYDFDPINAEDLIYGS